jgi:hypothetical protein
MSTGVVFGTLAEQYEKLRAERFEKIATANIPEELRSKFIVVELEEMWTSLGSNPWAICCTCTQCGALVHASMLHVHNSTRC